ncbi:MAG: ribonuclease HII [Lachnospiraceae bacterium]|nr:ribonuclease HII [Lachnospiraceae bacterium]
MTKQERLEMERLRTGQMRSFERELALQVLGRDSGTVLIGGIDEAGRGPLAGPVSAAVVLLPDDREFPYVNDSKKLSPKKRDELYDYIRENAAAFSVALVDAQRIDEINILQATYEAMRKAVADLEIQPEVLVNDAVKIPGIELPQIPVVKGDAKCLSIAAASILAKVTRDRLMEEYDRQYPEYGFASHKGYGTAQHIAAIRKYGPCPIHRQSFIGHFL